MHNTNHKELFECTGTILKQKLMPKIAGCSHQTVSRRSLCSLCRWSMVPWTSWYQMIEAANWTGRCCWYHIYMTTSLLPKQGIKKRHQKTGISEADKKALKTELPESQQFTILLVSRKSFKLAQFLAPGTIRLQIHHFTILSWSADVPPGAETHNLEVFPWRSFHYYPLHAFWKGRSYQHAALQDAFAKITKDFAISSQYSQDTRHWKGNPSIINQLQLKMKLTLKSKPAVSTSPDFTERTKTSKTSVVLLSKARKLSKHSTISWTTEKAEIWRKKTSCGKEYLQSASVCM